MDLSDIGVWNRDFAFLDSNWDWSTETVSKVQDVAGRQEEAIRWESPQKIMGSDYLKDQYQ